MSAAVLTAGIVAAALLVVAVPVLIGKVISLGDRLDDGADVPFSEPHETHVREAVALANSRPLCEAIVDELAQRRGAVSS